MISKKMTDRINEQINREMYSAYLYMAMSASVDAIGYHGIAKWLVVQYHEEMFHAMKLYHYLQDQGSVPELKAIAKPEFKQGPMKELFVQILEHEKYITKSIHEVKAQAIEEKDFATESFIQWYVNEQVEEEKHAADLVQTIDLLGNSSQGTFMLNIELGKRALTVPSNFNEVG